MAQVLAGVNLSRVAQLTLDALTTVGIPLSAFTTDFTADALPKGETITTRFATIPTTQDFDASKTRTDSNTTARPVTLDDYRGVAIGFKDTELTYTDQNLGEMFVVPAISSLVDYVINKTLENVTTGNGFTNTLVVTAADFDADDASILAEGLSTRKVSPNGRSLILKPTYFGSLTRDAKITAASDGPAGVDPLRNRRIPQLHGMGLHEYNGTIPANSINMEGIACGKQGLIIAARSIVEPPAGTWYGRIENIVDPNSGLPIQIREYYDNNELKYEFSTLFGTAIGIADYVTTICSA